MIGTNDWTVSHLDKKVFIYDSMYCADELTKQLGLMYGRRKENGATGELSQMWLTVACMLSQKK